MDALEQRFEEVRIAGGFDRAFERWRRKRASVRSLRGFEELVALCRNKEAGFNRGPNLAITALCSLAKTEDAEAALFLIWRFIPLFRRLRRQIGTCDLSAEDLEAEMLAGFWEGVSRPGQPELTSGRIYRAVQHRAWAAVTAASRERAQELLSEEDDLIASLEMVPEPNLQDALKEADLNADEIDLIVSTRVGGRDLADLAREMGLSHSALGMRRVRAEKKLTRWLEGQAS